MTRAINIAIIRLAIGVLALTGCQDMYGPEADTVHSDPAAEIVDAARGGGDGFYFLPPLVPPAGMAGEFDPELLPFLAVEVCQLWGGECVGDPIERFTSETGGLVGRLRVVGDVLHQRAGIDLRHYNVLWPSGRSDLDTASNYRIRVLAGPVELGYADIDVVNGWRQLRNVDTDEFVPLLEGWVLPIRFWLSTEALAGAGAALVGVGGGSVESLDGRARVMVPPGALSTSTILAVAPAPGVEIPAIGGPILGVPYSLQPAGFQFHQPVQVALSVAGIPTDEPEFLALVHFGEAGDFADILATELSSDGTLVGRVDHFSFLWFTKCPSRTWCTYNLRWEDDLAVSWFADTQTFTVLTTQMVEDQLRAWESVAGIRFTPEPDRNLANLVFEESADPCRFWSIDRAGVACFPFGARSLPWQSTLGLGDQVTVRINGSLVGSHTAPGTVLHEIGHAIGIAHTKVSNDAVVMDADAVPPTSLHQWDVEAAQFLYGPPPNTLAYWRFDESMGATVADASGNGNHGTVSHHVWGGGVRGAAIEFDGLSTEIIVPHAASLNDVASAMTIELWIKPLGPREDEPFIPLVVKNQPGVRTGYFLGFTGDQWMWFAGGVQITHPYSLTSGEWHHVVAVKDGPLLGLFVDDVQIAAASGATDVVPSSFQLEIGGSNSLDRGSFNGVVDEVKISNVAKRPVQPPSSSTILFTSGAQGSQDLWAISADGMQRANLSAVSHDPTGMHMETDARFSPDGSQIIFTSDKAGVPFKTFIMNSDGTNARALNGNVNVEFVPFWSPDGHRIYYVRNTLFPTQHIVGECSPCPHWEIYEYDLASGVESQLTSNSSREWAPIASPDGSSIAFIRAERANDCCNPTDVWVMDADGQNARQLSPSNGQYEWTYDWDPVNNKILTTWGTEVVLLDPAGSAQQLTFGSATQSPVAFSPDGSTVLLGRGGDIYLLDIASQQVVQFLVEPGDQHPMDWGSPAGPWASKVASVARLSSLGAWMNAEPATQLTSYVSNPLAWDACTPETVGSASRGRDGLK